MDAIAPPSVADYSAPPVRRRRGRPEWLAWAAFAPLAAWLVLLVVGPTVMLLAVSVCETDPDLGTPTPHFTLGHYRDIFEAGVGRPLGHAAIAAAVGAVVLLAVRRSIAAVRWGTLIGGCGYLSYLFGVLSPLRRTSLPDGGLSPELAPLLRVLWRSVELAGLSTALCLLIGYPVAFHIGRARPQLRERLLLLVMIPFWTSFLIRTYAWVTILNQNGLLNAALRGGHLGVLIPSSGGLLYTPTAVVIGLVYAYLPFMILPIYGSVERLDASLIEASLDLGAGPVRTLAKVVLPLTAPGIAAGVLLVFVPAIGMYAVSTLLGGARTPMIGDLINDQYAAGNDQPLGAALGVTLMASFGLVFLATGVRRLPRG